MLEFSAIEVGFRAQQQYVIAPAIYEHFLAAFRDVNPLHIEPQYAQARGFEDTVMHGAIVNGFISHFVGVCFPGHGALLHSVEVQYNAPNYLHDEILLEATVIQKVDSLRVLVMRIVVTNVRRNRVSARARVQVGLT